MSVLTDCLHWGHDLGGDWSPLLFSHRLTPTGLLIEGDFTPSKILSEAWTASAGNVVYRCDGDLTVEVAKGSRQHLGTLLTLKRLPEVHTQHAHPVDQ